MPDPVTHYVFGRQVLAELPEEIQNTVTLSVFDRALQGPDPWSDIGFYGGRNKKYAVRSSIMHTSETGKFLTALAEQASKDMSVPVFSVLAGMICHYCLDMHTHPYIICKGGWYDGTEQTRDQSGGHVRLERAIDSLYIRTVFGKVPWHFSIPKEIMKCRQYPESLRQPLNDVYRDVYGWESVFDQVNASLRDERRFYGLMQDSLGLVHYLLRPVSNGKTNFCIYSFYRRDIDSKVLDYLNLKHTPWHHPYEPSEVSTDSFLDLYDRAKGEAARLICAAFEWICHNGSQDLGCLFGNCSYSTGLDCGDPRNLQAPVCEPLRYPHKYWNA